jgi:hypothetical protein
MLGMLALFTLIAATFVISAGHFRRGARSASRAEQTGDTFEVLLQQALMQVVRGSKNPQSVLQHHSLLEDLYGDADSTAGMVVETTMDAGLSFAGVGGPALPESTTLATRGSFYPTAVSNVPFNTPGANPPLYTPMLLEFSAVGFGWDKEPGIALVDDNQNGVVDDVGEAFAGDDAVLGATYAHPVTCGIAPGPASVSVWQNKMLPAIGSNPPQPLPFIDNVDNYYAGRVITFLSGAAAGKSSHIIRSKAVPAGDGGACVTLLWVQPLFGDARPTNRDRFIINGRPFNGTGFGYSPYNNNVAGDMSPKMNFSTSPAQLDISRMRRLDMGYVNPLGMGTDKDRLVGVPIALLPNPTDIGYREYLEAAWPIIDADEDYDAADLQNMLLAHRMWNSERGRYETVMPSLHRPDLVNYFMRNFGYSDWTQIPPMIRRRIILRPEAADHYDYTQEPVLDPDQADGWTPPETYTDANGNGQWDPGEPYVDRPPTNNAYDTGDRTFAATAFDAVNGPWDVDNDGDGEADSIWVDLGMPVTTLADGRAVKPLFAILCTDLDGRLNANAHGSPSQYIRVEVPADPLAKRPANGFARGSTEERIFLGAGGYFLSQADLSGNFTWTSSMIKQQLDGRQMNQVYIGESTESAYGTWYSSDQPKEGTESASVLLEPAVGQGWSVADVNFGAYFVRHRWHLPSLPVAATNTPATFPSWNHYRRLLEGEYGSKGSNYAATHAVIIGSQTPTMGRYGEVHLLRSHFNTPALNTTEMNPGLMSPPRAGVSDHLKTPIGLTVVATAVPNALFNDVADDDYPGTPSPNRNGGGNAIQVRGNSSYDSMITPIGTPNIRFGAYGTPGDPNSDGYIGLDLAGRPIYKNMGIAGETRDEPWEINLMRRYSPRAQAVSTFTTNGTVDIDANFTPGEMARLLRETENDTNAYEDRLRSIVDIDNNSPRYNTTSQAITTEQWDIPCPHIAPTPEMAVALRMMGLPVNNPSLADLLRARFYLATGGGINSAVASRLATISMRSYRMTTEATGNMRNSQADFVTYQVQGVNNPAPPPGWKPHYAADTVNPLGGVSTHRLTPIGLKRKNVRLISPDLVVGLRMNVNAPFGNGYDDDYDGVVDEPTEGAEVGGMMAAIGSNAAPHEPLWTYWSGNSSVPPRPHYQGFNWTTQYAATGVPFDGDRDGNFDKRIDEMARQQHAKELYCLMMLLLDQKYVIPYFEQTTAVDANGAITASGTQENLGFSWPSQLTTKPEWDRTHNAKAWLTARQIAQWAINAVDFRDRDSIMTPFEFDVNPYLDDDGDCSASPTAMNAERPNCNGTWDVDGYVTDDPVASVGDSERAWRGLVWGCEYPDLILTETIAFHDRRTSNLQNDTTGTVEDVSMMNPKIARTTGFTLASYEGRVLTTDTCDPHWDQYRTPQGTAMFELYATGNPHLSVRITHSTTDKSSPDYGTIVAVESMLPRELYTPDGRLDLSKTITGTRPGTTTIDCNPVWRLLITAAAPVTDTMHPNNVAQRAARHPSTCSFNPIESYGSLQTGAAAPRSNFSILPPLFTQNGLDYQPVQISRVVTFQPAVLTTTMLWRDRQLNVEANHTFGDPNNSLAAITMTVNATPEDQFNVTSHPDYIKPDIYRYYDRRYPYRPSPVPQPPSPDAQLDMTRMQQSSPILAAPGDYVVIGPHRMNATTTELDNVTSMGTVCVSTTHMVASVTNALLSQTINAMTGSNLLLPPISMTTLTIATLTSGSPAALLVHHYPPPIIDLGLNPRFPVATTPTTKVFAGPSIVTTVTTAHDNILNPANNVHPGRRMMVTSQAGVDEYPKATAIYSSAYNDFRTTTTMATISPYNNISSTLYSQPAGTFGQAANDVSLPQIRTPIVVPVAIDDTNSSDQANFGYPLGLNISEPQVLAGIGDAAERHGLLYLNTAASTTSGLTREGVDGNLSSTDTWIYNTAPTHGEGPYPDEPFDGHGLTDSKVSTTSESFDRPPVIKNPEFRAMGINHLYDQTYLNVKTVFLQRLADPTRVWEKDTNPYLTIDWMPIDLTVFNGTSLRYTDNVTKAMHTFDPDNPPFRHDSARHWPGSATGTETTQALPPYYTGRLVDGNREGSSTLQFVASQVRFGSRQRGSPPQPFRGQTSMFDLWSQPNWLDTDMTSPSDWYAAPPPTGKIWRGNVVQRYALNVSGTSVASTGVRWQHPMQHTFGYINVGYHIFRTWAGFANKPTTYTPQRLPYIRPQGFRGSRGIGTTPVDDMGWYIGDDVVTAPPSPTNSRLAATIGSPKRPFNWLAWNNRPYASALELMNVPCSGPTRLLHDYDMRHTAYGPMNQPSTYFPDDGRRSANEYLTTVPIGSAASARFGYAQTTPFPHLLNFFNSSVAAPALGTSNTVAAFNQPNFYRIFEFLTVPSRFAGTQQFHLHGRYTATSGLYTGLWNQALRPRQMTETGWPDQLQSFAATNPGTVNIMAAQFEHPGWPFTAPFNTISQFREPGRVNINTIPVLQAGESLTTALRSGDKQSDFGATIWRGVTNEFFPAVHMFGAGTELNSKARFQTTTTQFEINRRAINVITGTGYTRGNSNGWESPSDDYVDNFYNMFSNMRSDWPRFDIRGPNAYWQNGGGDDRSARKNSIGAPPPVSRDDFNGVERMDPQKPAWIANPIRSFMEDYSATVPQPLLTFTNPYVPPAENFQSAYQRLPYLAVDSTLLRRKDTTWTPWTSNGDALPVVPQTTLHMDPVFDPLFVLNFPRPNAGQAPNSLPPPIQPGHTAYTAYVQNPDPRGNSRTKIGDYRNSDRNPFFRYQLYTKLGSTVTTRSNVYAIWITVGQFECERVASTTLPSQAGMGNVPDMPMIQRFPDGFRILREFGSDTGETRRHKIFAIFDRSIPVGFKRGENYNVDQAFLVRHIVN